MNDKKARELITIIEESGLLDEDLIIEAKMTGLCKRVDEMLSDIFGGEHDFIILSRDLSDHSDLVNLRATGSITNNELSRWIRGLVEQADQEKPENVIEH